MGRPIETAPDTHLLLWLSDEPSDLAPEAPEMLEHSSNEVLFSVASVWEFAIKFALGRPDFRVDPRVLRRGLLDNGYAELPVTADHALDTLALPRSTRTRSTGSSSRKRRLRASCC